ncbi:MAG: TetR/AcrR family transcriptional regulator [Treponema sp.]|jgi:AcrR family transcriptional regulator|nr:TetR/AcrR family transcriptional regulator [Treponema sp.]
MGISERREREKIERRKTILDCARELVLLQGVERVSMEDIARKAELSKATVYLYFSGKDVLLNEICEEAAREFLEYFKPFWRADVSGIEALKCFWRGYVELFGNSNEMLIIFKVHSHLNSWLPIVSPGEESKSPSIDAILEAIKATIDKCKAEGFFDPALDSARATRLILSMFSVIMENAARLPLDARKSPAIVEEMTSAFQIIIRGFAKDGIERTAFDIF